ncbi:hypothetical protein O181_064714 [Austropuccinia psidii MF-1]|uniref:Uncharacterized protein n=1 Tax=Austropuccinia psidii MF-1 TaxID=1389203 RepID=A0A9Q3EPN8_9BASI|nr:hypothetical protein [Austropuccinia psidii MF-1]
MRINNMLVGSPTPPPIPLWLRLLLLFPHPRSPSAFHQITSHCLQPPNRLLPPVQGTSQSHNEALEEFTNMKPTPMIPQAIFSKFINQVFLENNPFLHMIPFVNGTHQNEMHPEFYEDLNSLLGNVLEGYPKEVVTGTFLKFLKNNS